MSPAERARPAVMPFAFWGLSSRFLAIFLLLAFPAMTPDQKGMSATAEKYIDTNGVQLHKILKKRMQNLMLQEFDI